MSRPLVAQITAAHTGCEKDPVLLRGSVTVIRGKKQDLEVKVGRGMEHNGLLSRK